MNTATTSTTTNGTKSPHGHRGGRIIGLGLLVILLLLQLLPFYVTLTSSLKERTDLSSQWAFPFAAATIENFRTAIEDGNILRAVINTVVVTLCATVLICGLGALAAYPLARRRTPINGIVKAAIVALMMIPPLAILVPLYTFLNQIGGVNSYWATILVLTAGQLPLSIFLYSSFIQALPISIEEAAAIDGAGPVGILFRVVFPMLKPVTATVVIMTSVNVWNEYALSNYLMTKPNTQMIAPAIASFFAAQSSNLGAAAASALIAAVPILVAYLFLQRYFIEGMVAGSGK
ncbi:carbohydrate ABC transporter permease [Actinomyces ruminicola]|uniref:Raffinose/stachyose/melibiose transport system permease protein n=1 Tax=Actinomyces ruminicola TaxID=332524 RepID=A0A1G9XS45_9ACTO|nr:carbohydrate ABC transporter permease [Actinomyces ruminicola]MBE6481871.1 carbohydrate ABC transporter permease [Actinomyces ruminicola]SDM99627.1 raffinose/stachyose/melibiose transport system permease protein [Actinomyces ruminicola]